MGFEAETDQLRYQQYLSSTGSVLSSSRAVHKDSADIDKAPVCEQLDALHCLHIHVVICVDSLNSFHCDTGWSSRPLQVHIGIPLKWASVCVHAYVLTPVSVHICVLQQIWRGSEPGRSRTWEKVYRELQPNSNSFPQTQTCKHSQGNKH